MAKTAKNAQAGAAPAQGRTGALEWGHLRFFLELVRTGSLSQAARRLKVDRNTVARRVAALEDELGLSLFERGPQGWTRTSAGEELAALALRVEDDVLALARHAVASDRALSGTVRLTTAMHLSAHLLAPAVPSLRARHPGLLLEIAADARAFDLGRREADLALRMGRPREAGLVTRKLSDVSYRFYAARGSTWAGDSRVDFGAHPFIGPDETSLPAPHERWLASTAPRRRVVFRCNSTASLVAASVAGVGVALLPCFVAERVPELARLEGPEPAHHELWLLVHGDLRRTPRVAAVIDWLDEVVAEARPRLCPAG